LSNGDLDHGGLAFRKLGERSIWQGAVISVAAGTFLGPAGERFEREVVHHPGAVVVVPLLDNNRVLLVCQYRAAVDAELLEVPAGKRDIPEEPPEVTASRELAEEVGKAAGSFELLARFHNSPGFSDEMSWCYLARHLSDVPGDLQGLEEQHLRLEEVALADVPRLIATGEIIDAKTIIGLLLAREAIVARS